MSWEKVALILSRFFRSLWFLPSVYALVSILILAIAPVLSVLVPVGLIDLIDPGAVDKLLGILASSMLAVAIFSLGTMVSALHASASASTPRVRVLLTEDRTAQTAISTFIGAFIFSVLSIIALSTQVYGNASRFVIFVTTVVIITVVIGTLISWINRLSRIGGVGEAVELTERATRKAFDVVACDPYYGGRRLENIPADAEPVYLEAFGFIQHVDGTVLAELCEDAGIDVYLVARPGRYTDLSRPVVFIKGAPPDDIRERIRDAFSIGDSRTFEEDPRFGLLVLSQIGSRALSPGVNDPGTAIDVLSAAVRVLARWREAVREKDVKVKCTKLHVVELEVDEVVGDAFKWLSRDGAGMLEVSMRIQRSLATLIAVDADAFGAAVRKMSEEAIERCEQAMSCRRDLEMITDLRIELELA